MSGPHDLGGQHGLGPVDPEPEAEEPVFHDDWERRAFALTLACGMLGKWNIDEGRFARESQHPVDYLSNTYYENWLAGLETLLVEKGIVSSEELETGRAGGKAEGYRVPDAAAARKILATGGPSRMTMDLAPGFQVGDRVRVIHNNPWSHTRAPRYTRNHVGTVSHDQGVHIFADAHAQGRKEGVHLYSVRFEPDELWGADGDGRSAVYVDLWEPHLEAA